MSHIFAALRAFVIAVAASLLVVVAGCNSNPSADTNAGESADTPAAQVEETAVSETPEPTEDIAESQTVTVAMTATSDPTVEMGEVSFSATDAGLLIEANLKNVPAGEHGFHIHEVDSCEEGGKAAGGHFNPDKTQHGYLPDDGLENAHAGDLGNISIAEDGMGSLSLTLSELTFDTQQYGIKGRSVILHEQKDDFGQPTGNAGGRIGCGIT